MGLFVEEIAAAEHEAASRCAWCDSESGVAFNPELPPISHTVCARHFCMTLLRGGNVPVQMIKDRVVRLYGAPEGLASFGAAMVLVAHELKGKC